MPSVLRAAPALRLELSARAELEQRSAVALGRHHYPTAAVHEVAQAVTAMTRHRLLRALMAGFGVVLAHGPSLFKLRGAPVTQVCGKTYLLLGPGGGAARAIAAAFSSAASRMALAVALAGWRWQAAIVAGTIIADRLIRCHMAPRVHARLDGGRACNRACTTRKTNRGALNRRRGALLDRLFDPARWPLREDRSSRPMEICPMELSVPVPSPVPCLAPWTDDPSPQARGARDPGRDQ